MISALFFLQFNSLRNRLRARLRRLKRPKYLIGAIIGGLYFIFYFSFLITGPRPGVSGNSDGSPISAGWGETIGAILLFAVVLLNWVLPNERAALAFTEAEIAFLFPAPITRRGLIHYKLVRSQIGILFSVIFLTLIWGRWRTGGHIWISALGWWVILSTLSLHTLASSFARTILFDRGITNWKRRGIILGGVVAILGVVFMLGRNHLPPWPSNPDADPREYLNWLDAALTTGVIPYLLLPFRLVVAPYFAADAASFIWALGPALAIMALHYILVIRADVAFEEASITYSQKLATRLATMRERRSGVPSAPKKGRRAPFNLAPTGLPSLAFLWKNLILAGANFSPRFFLRVFLLLFIGGALVMQHGLGDSPWPLFVTMLCVMFFMMSLFIGPSLLRVDFRADLNVADQLMLYPLPGWQIVLGEILAPVAILTAVQWLLILAVAMFFTLPEVAVHTTGDTTVTQLSAQNHAIPLELRVGFALAAAILAPAIDLIMLIIPNAVALLLPSWVRFDKNAPRGFENFGQMIILAIGQLLVMAVALAPAGLVFWVIELLASLALDPALATLLAALAAATMLVVEAATAIYILGHAFERFDVSAETTN